MVAKILKNKVYRPVYQISRILKALVIKTVYYACKQTDQWNRAEPKNRFT